MSVHLGVAEGVGTIRLDRPPMNALDIATQDRLGELAPQVTERDDIRALIPIQNGTRHAWRNHGDRPATMAFVLISVPHDGERA